MTSGNCGLSGVGVRLGTYLKIEDKKDYLKNSHQINANIGTI